MNDPISKAYRAIYQKPVEQPVVKEEENLPALYDGKYEEPDGNDKPSYYRDDKKQIEEETEIPHIEGLKVRELDDYDKGMYQHSVNMKAEHVSFDGTEYEHHDKAIHDLVKDGLTPEKYLAAKHILHNLPYYHTSVRSPSDLKAKYDYLDKYAATEDRDYTPEESFLSKDEIKTHLDSGYKFIRGRKIMHIKTGIYLQLHPDGSKTISANGAGDSPVDDHDRKKVNETGISLDEHYGNHISEHVAPDGASFRNHVHMYTTDSRELNTYLGHQYHGHDYPDSDYRRHTNDTLEAHSEALSHSIEHAPPLPHDTTIYTGLSHMTKVHTMTEGGTKSARFMAPTFLSTSIKPSIAADFAREKSHPESEEVAAVAAKKFDSDTEPNEFGHSKMHDMLKIELPKGFRGGVYVDKYSGNRGEKEMIIDKHHVVNVHPEPKYFAHDRKIIRMWDAHLEPKKYDTE